MQTIDCINKKKYGIKRLNLQLLHEQKIMSIIIKLSLL